jgi:hypothetical protein
MANSVDVVIASEAIKQVENLIAKLSLADAELIKISQSAINAGKGISGISTPNGMDKAVSNTTALNAELEKQNVIINKLHADIAKKAEQSRLSEIKLQQAREKSFDTFEKNAKKESAIAEKTASAYNKTQTQINNLTKVYNDLALRKERYNNLSVNEEMRLGTLGKVTEKYNGILKQTDATIGKNQRNVGNYASGYNALGNSINQLSREAPAFANSVNTGFMALSNNFPALFDAISGIRKQNALLVAEGKPTTSLFKQLVAGVFSWQTMLSVGVTLLTLYGGKIIEWATGLTKAQKAQEALNEEIVNSKSLVSSESTQLQSLTAIVNDHNESSSNRKLAYEEIKKTLPGLTSATYEQAVSTGELTKVTDLYILSLIQKNIVEAEAKSIAEQQTSLNKETSKSYKENIGVVESYLQSLQPERQRKNIEKTMKAQIKAEQDAQQTIINNRQKALVKAQEDYLKTQSQLKPFVTDPKKAKSKKDKKEDTTPKLEGVKSDLKTIGTLITEINAEIERLKVEKIVSNDAELPAVNFQLEQLIKLKEQINGLPETDFKIVNTAVKSKEALKELSEEQKKYLDSFTSDFISSSGFTETFKILNNEIDGFGENFKVTFNAIAESAQEVYNFISEQSQKNFEGEYSRLESQKDIALKFAGDSTVAKAKIEEDYEKKRKEIAYREAKAKQKQAIFNIAIDTAQAVMATLGKAGFAGIPLSVIIGAIGAAQIAMVSAQKIPQYFEGGTHGGGLAMINDAGGSNYVETVVTPDGKVSQYSGRDVVTNLPKGTEIFTPEQWRDKQLEYMLNSKGISMNSNYNSSNGMTSQEMDAIMEKHFAKIQTNHTSFDKNGIRQWSERNGNKTIINNARGEGKGFNV